MTAEECASPASRALDMIVRELGAPGSVLQAHGERWLSAAMVARNLQGVRRRKAPTVSTADVEMALEYMVERAIVAPMTDERGIILGRPQAYRWSRYATPERLRQVAARMGHREPVCEWCGCALRASTTGQKMRFCSQAHGRAARDAKAAKAVRA